MAGEKTDEKLLLDRNQREREVFTEIVQKYWRRIFAVTYRYLGNIHDAQDMTQEVFTRAYGAFLDFKNGGNVYGWLVKIAVNLCINETKSMRRKKSEPYDDECEAQMHDVHENREIVEVLKGVLTSLPESQRMAVILSKFEGMSYQEISQVMGKSVSSVESLLARARKTIAKKMQKYISLEGSKKDEV